MFAELKKYNIEPLVTISHYETPLALADKYNGWANRKLIDIYLKVRIVRTVLLMVQETALDFGSTASTSSAIRARLSNYNKS